MHRAEIAEKIYAMIAEHCDKKDIKEEHDLKNDLQMDSLGVSDFMTSCENEFDIVIHQEEVEGVIKTVKDVIDYLAKRLDK